MPRFYLLDYDKALSSIVAQANTADENSAIESIPLTQKLPQHLAIIRSSDIREFVVMAPTDPTNSPDVVIRGGAAPPVPPAGPTLLAVTLVAGQISLAWTGTAARYEVFRDGEWVGAAAGAQFVDAGADVAKQHVYDVHAVRGTSRSDPATVKFTPA